MKIAVMMRAIDQDSGFRVYVDGLLDALLRIDDENTYLLLYRTPKWFGRFGSFPNAREILLRAPHKFLWDQVAVPYRAWREGADVIFNPKFSVPLVSHCPVVMGLQEPAPWAWPQHYERFDVLYQRLMLPIYCRKAAHFFPMAQWILEENRKRLRLPFRSATVTHPAPHAHLHPVEDREALEKFRAHYRLPDPFLLVVTRVDHPGLDASQSFYPGKNPHTALRAFLLLRDRIPHHLVVAGRRVREYFIHMGFTEADFERVHFLDFVPFEHLAHLYSLATLLIVPPYYEGFGFGLMGAMAAGCPAVVSSAGACPEVVGDAALLADPESPADFAAQIERLLSDEPLRRELRRRALERAATWTWEKTARLTLEGLTRAARRS